MQHSFGDIAHVAHGVCAISSSLMDDERRWLTVIVAQTQPYSELHLKNFKTRRMYVFSPFPAFPFRYKFLRIETNVKCFQFDEQLRWVCFAYTLYIRYMYRLSILNFVIWLSRCWLSPRNKKRFNEAEIRELFQFWIKHEIRFISSNSFFRLLKWTWGAAKFVSRSLQLDATEAATKCSMAYGLV